MGRLEANCIRRQQSITENKADYIEKIYRVFTQGSMEYTRHKDCIRPAKDDMTEWLLTSAVDKYKIDWNKIKNGDFDEMCELFSCYYDYLEAGGSRKKRKDNSKINPITIFENAKLHGQKVNFAKRPSQVKEDTDLAFLHENEDFLFVLVLTHRGANWCNTFNCGGMGARWCIGWEDDTSAWIDYVTDGDWFVLVFDKAKYRDNRLTTDKLKFMIQMKREKNIPHKNVAWLQTDFKNDVIKSYDWKETFDITYDELDAYCSEYEEVLIEHDFDYATIGCTYNNDWRYRL